MAVKSFIVQSPKTLLKNKITVKLLRQGRKQLRGGWGDHQNIVKRKFSKLLRCIFFRKEEVKNERERENDGQKDK